MIYMDLMSTTSLATRRLQVEIPFYGGVGRQRGRGNGALAQVIGRTAIQFLR